MSWDYTHDFPFEGLDWNTATWAMNIMQSVNGHDFTVSQKVGVMSALFFEHKAGVIGYETAVERIADGLEDMSDFSLFDASSLLALLYGRTKERTMDDLTERRMAGIAARKA